MVSKSDGTYYTMFDVQLKPYISYYWLYIISNVFSFVGTVVIVYICSFVDHPMSMGQYNKVIRVPYEYIILEECIFKNILRGKTPLNWFLNSLSVSVIYYILTQSIIFSWQSFVLSIVANVYLETGGASLTILIVSRLIIHFSENYF